ncbi:MAG: hypothetical protein V4615_05065 [Bacteroidota bacterium]
MKLTNEQIARVFGMYLGCEMVHGRFHGHMEVIKGTGQFRATCSDWWEDVSDNKYKLVLIPLSSITDEDAIEVAKIHGSYSFDGRTFKVRGFKDWLNSGGNIRYNMYQYLIQQGYAVPLFIAPNHPANGKTAIELGLAIEKTKEAKDEKF